jgi:hypothetical protein
MRRSLLLLVLGLAALPGCQSKVDTTGQSSEGFAAPDRSMVYDAAVNALRQQGFTPDSSACSEAQGVITTRHKLDLSPFSAQGFRDKATVRIHDVPQRPGFYTVEVNVLREYNDNITQPSNPIAAEWRRAVRVPELENLIKSRVEMAYIAPDASTQFRETHGLPQGSTGRIPELRTEPDDTPKGWFPAK